MDHHNITNLHPIKRTLLLFLVEKDLKVEIILEPLHEVVLSDV